jgi:non-canonical (house-cleaning) NTP pyrophosphatase
MQVHVCVGSLNKKKIDGMREALEKYLRAEEFQLDAVETDSNVSEMPLSDEETLQGATNRANSSLRANAGNDVGVGIEGGVCEMNGIAFLTIWVVLASKQGKHYIASSQRVQLPRAYMQTMRDERVTLHDLLTRDSPQYSCQASHLSRGVLNREKITCDALIFAVSAWLLDLPA